VRIATWNVNSLKARMPRVMEWLDAARPDVLCMQETKLADDQVPVLDFESKGYTIVHHGEGRWNGVAIASSCGITGDAVGFGGLDDPYVGDARLVAATCRDVRVVSVYVPNGREVGSEFYERKLLWLRTLRDWLEANHSPDEPLVVCGDFNVAPDDRDVYDPKAFVGSTHVSPEERAALQDILDWGLTDAFREIYDAGGLYTWWDYRAGNFHKGKGLRIDLALVTKPLVERVTYALVDRNARKGEKPSDHAPLFIDLAE